MNHRTACGGLVIVSRALISHMQAHPVSREHLAEAISTLTLPRRCSLSACVDLGRVIGLSRRVEVAEPEDGSTILAAVRKGRRDPSRVVVGSEPTPTTSLAVVTRTNAGKTYLATAFYGTPAPPEPHDAKLSAEDLEASLAFWSRQALVWSPDGYAGPPFETTWQRIRDGHWKLDSRIPRGETLSTPGP